MDYVDETDFNKEYEHYFSVQGEMLKRNFEKRDVKTTLLQNGDEVKSFISDFISDRQHIKRLLLVTECTLSIGSL